MVEIQHCWVPIEPKPKQRPKGKLVRNRRGKPYLQFFTPKATHDYQDAFLEQFSEQFECSSSKAKLVLFMHFQKSHKRKSDVDNLAKAVMDALNGYLYYDDSQVTVLHASMRNSVKTEAGTLIGFCLYSDYKKDPVRCHAEWEKIKTGCFEND